MSEHVTLLLPDAPQPRDPRGISSAFPPELLDQVRRRVRLLALLMLAAFGLDLVVYALNWAPVLAGYPPPLVIDSVQRPSEN